MDISKDLFESCATISNLNQYIVYFNKVPIYLNFDNLVHPMIEIKRNKKHKQ